MGKGTKHDGTADFGTENFRTNWIGKVFQISHASQLQLDLEEIVTVLNLSASIDEVKHWRREHFLCIVLVV